LGVWAHGVPRRKENAAAVLDDQPRTALRIDVPNTTVLHLLASCLMLDVFAQLAQPLINKTNARAVSRVHSFGGPAMPPLKNARSLRRERRIHTLNVPGLT
jgi:hypothetical protein